MTVSPRSSCLCILLDVKLEEMWNWSKTWKELYSLLHYIFFFNLFFLYNQDIGLNRCQQTWHKSPLMCALRSGPKRTIQLLLEEWIASISSPLIISGLDPKLFSTVLIWSSTEIPFTRKIHTCTSDVKLFVKDQPSGNKKK